MKKLMTALNDNRSRSEILNNPMELDVLYVGEIYSKGEFLVNGGLLHSFILKEVVYESEKWNDISDSDIILYKDNEESTFQIRLKKARKIKKWTQGELAKNVQLPISSIGHFENGDRKPSFNNLIKLAIALEASSDYLLGITSYHEIKEIN